MSTDLDTRPPEPPPRPDGVPHYYAPAPAPAPEQPQSMFRRAWGAIVAAGVLIIN
ncbi:MAG: hypothetical protein QOC95_2291, partial [Thermoleophilaceae bacterium]|nr:hypothetical protein [Thermoleophilaceae bacterium]